MPGLDGTGPQGKGPINGRGFGRGFGRCRRVPEPAQEPAIAAQPAQSDNGPAISPGAAQDIPVYGRGRGGVPRGCGRGIGGSRRPKS